MLLCRKERRDRNLGDLLPYTFIGYLATSITVLLPKSIYTYSTVVLQYKEVTTSFAGMKLLGNVRDSWLLAVSIVYCIHSNQVNTFLSAYSESRHLVLRL